MIQIKWGRGWPDMSYLNQVQLVLWVTDLPDSNQFKILIRVTDVEKLLFSSVQFDLSQGMCMIRFMHIKSQIFMIFKILWDFPFNLTWTNNTHGSYSTNSTNLIKASWLNSNITIELCILKTNQFKIWFTDV